MGPRRAAQPEEGGEDGGAQRGPRYEDVHGAGVGAAERHDHPRPGTLLSDQVDLQGHYYQTRLVASRSIST